MDGFKNIEIKNFRGIDHLKIDDFSRVNILLGQNSSGKSSVLEAISLLTGIGNPDSPLNMNRLRTRNLFSPFKDLYYLFYNMDVKTPLEISSEQFDGDMRDLRLQLTYVFDEQTARQGNGLNGVPPVSETKTFLNTLCMDFDIVSASGKRSYQSSMTANQEGIISNKKPAADYLEKNTSVYLTADLWGINLASQLSELFKRKQKNILLQRLSHFDPGIVDVDILQDIALNSKKSDVRLDLVQKLDDELLPLRFVFLQFLQPCVLVLVDGDAQELNFRIVLVLGYQFLHKRNFLAAGTAPSGPYVDICELSLNQAAEFHCLAVRSGQFHIGCLSTCLGDFCGPLLLHELVNHGLGDFLVVSCPFQEFLVECLIVSCAVTIHIVLLSNHLH